LSSAATSFFFDPVFKQIYSHFEGQNIIAIKVYNNSAYTRQAITKLPKARTKEMPGQPRMAGRRWLPAVHTLNYTKKNHRWDYPYRW